MSQNKSGKSEAVLRSAVGFSLFALNLSVLHSAFFHFQRKNAECKTLSIFSLSASLFPHFFVRFLSKYFAVRAFFGSPQPFGLTASISTCDKHLYVKLPCLLKSGFLVKPYIKLGCAHHHRVFVCIDAAFLPIFCFL